MKDLIISNIKFLSLEISKAAYDPQAIETFARSIKELTEALSTIFSLEKEVKL